MKNISIKKKDMVLHTDTIGRLKYSKWEKNISCYTDKEKFSQFSHFNDIKCLLLVVTFVAGQTVRYQCRPVQRQLEHQILLMVVHYRLLDTKATVSCWTPVQKTRYFSKTNI